MVLKVIIGILIFVVAIQLLIIGYFISERLNDRGEQKCYNYCDEAKAGIRNIINKLDTYEVVE